MLRVRRLFLGVWCGLGATLATAQAGAQIDLEAIARARLAPAAGVTAQPFSGAFMNGRAGRVPLVVRARETGVAVAASELTTLGDFAVAELDPERAVALARAHPEWSFEWSPPRHLLLDQVDGWVHAAAVRDSSQTSGKGVVVGIVDTGVSLTHPDLQTSDGKTRVAWLIDFSRPAVGLHPDLESVYGCGQGTDCAVYAGSDLDTLLQNNISGDEPTDNVGHGTHVASLAAGNGLSTKPAKYIGIAPEATYVIARVTRSNGGSILDTDILSAVKFVFDRAADLGMPAVVNLSLGSDFGPHDGSSALEAGLASFVGPDQPGRAVVVAAGNSAGLYSDPASAYAQPLGVHTEVQIPWDSPTDVPLYTPAPDGDSASGVYVWMTFRPEDDVSVGLDDVNGEVQEPLSVGHGVTLKTSDLEIDLLNGTTGAADTVSPGPHNAVLVLNGKWATNRAFKLHFEGHGTAELWVQSTGGLDPEVSLGALFPRGEKEGTINVPASSPGVIAVGATINRTTWVDYTGKAVSMPSFGTLSMAPLDTIAFFSAAGPNARGVLKPDIVAPGVYVAGAMAPSADPRDAQGGLFSSLGRCAGNRECFVVDEFHAITTGTSMSAPIVSGAIALLFERDPTLTQDGARALIQAGARPLQGVVLDERQVGPGALDLQGALSAATAGDSPALRVPGAKSWLVLSQSYAHPDPTWPVTGYVELRDDAGDLADGFDPSRLQLSAEPAVIIEPLTRVAAGLERFALAAPAGSGGRTLDIRISFDGQPFLARSLPIGVDRWVAEGGVSARGGCAFTGSRPHPDLLWLLVGAAGVGVRRRRRRHMRAK